MLSAATHYVSAAGGDDLAAGTSPDAPFRTIQRAATLAQPGDTVLIRGGTYRETVTPARSGTAAAPITFKAYNNEAVVVSGADVVGNWAGYKGAVYQAPQAWDLGLGNNQVFVDGQMMVEARWPNTTLDLSHPTQATMDAATATSTSGTLMDAELAGFVPGSWDGAILHMTPGQAWFAQTGTVTASATPGQLSFSYARMSGDETPTAGNNYYLTGKFQALDAPGEWFRDPGTGQLYLWTPGGDSPAAHTVEAKRRANAFDFKNLDYVTVEGIGLFAATVATNSASSNIRLNDIDAEYVGHFTVMPGRGQPIDAAILLQGDHNVLENSRVRWAAGNGVVLSGTDSRVENTEVLDTNYNGGSSAAIRLFGSGHTVTGNTVANTGRDGIKLSNSTDNEVTHNVIHDVMLQTTDGGAVYTYGLDGQGTEIAFNVIDGAHSGGNGAAGIMLDNDSSNYQVHHNVVRDADYGMKMNTTSRDNRVVANTFAADRPAIVGSKERDFTGSLIADNLFAAAPQVGSGATVVGNLIGMDATSFVDAAGGNLQLRAGSRAIDAGVRVAPYTDGFAGAAPDIGAYEFGRPAFAAGATVSVPSTPPTESAPPPPPAAVEPSPEPTPSTTAPDGAVAMEAEAAVLSGAKAVANVAGYGGAGFVDYLNLSGDYVEFTFDVPAGGAYATEFRYANGSTADRPLQLVLDGDAASAVDASFAPTGTWTSWRSAAGAAPVVLSAGRHTLRVAAAGKSGPNLDALTLRPAGAASDEPPAPEVPAAPFKVEAESAALRGVFASAARAGFTGTGFADYLNATGDYVRWTVDAAAAGIYELGFRYANGSSADRPLELKVNGAVAKPKVSFTPTGSWSAWQTATATVTLAAGSNVVQLTSVGASGANVDSLAVAPLAIA